MSNQTGAGTSVPFNNQLNKNGTKVPTPEGYKQTKVGVIPEEWEVLRINEVTDYVDYRGKTPKKVDNGTLLITARNIKQGYLDYETSKEYIDTKDYLNVMSRGVPKIGDVLLTTEAPLGNIAQIDNENIALAQRVIKFRGKNNLDNTYLKYHFLGNNFQAYLNRLAIGTTVLGIQGKQLHKMLIPVPPLKEQQKIAKILSTWDDAISRQEALIKAKEQLKKGLMQKLLSGEVRFGARVLTPSVGAETSVSSNNIIENGTKVPTPKDRINGTKVPTPEWEEIRLGDVATFHKGKGISKKDISDTGIECIRYGELYTKYTELIKDIISKTSIPKEELFLSRANDILIPASGETAIDLSTASCVLKKDIGLGGDINVIRTKNDGVFLAYYLNTIAKTKIASLAQGISVIHLYASQLKTLKIKLPPYEEQQKIAQTLTTADKEIELLKSELEVLKEQKRGLMQRLLSGDVRVVV